MYQPAPQGVAPLPTSYHVLCLPMLRQCLSLLHMCGLGLCPFSSSGLVCDLVPSLRGGRGLSPDCTCLDHNLDERCLENAGAVWCLAYPSGGAPLHWALRS